MDLLAFTYLLLRRGWLALLCAALLGTLPPASPSPRPKAREYEAITRVAVEPARQADYGQAQAAKEIMRSYTQDVRTFDMAEAAAAQLGEEWLAERELSAEALYWMIGVGSDTSVYDIEVKARADRSRDGGPGRGEMGAGLHRPPREGQSRDRAARARGGQGP